MTLDLSPAPGAAPLSRQVRTQAAMEAKLMLRNGEQLLLAVVVPLLVLVGGVFAAEQLDLAWTRPAIDVMTPGVLALAVMSSAFTSVAIATGFERRYGVIKRLGASPLSRTGLLVGKVAALVMVQALQLALIVAAAFAMGWQPHGWDSLLPALIAWVLGTATFASLGLFIAGVLRAEATLAVANLVYLLLMAGGAVVIPASSYGVMEHPIHYLPSGALGEAFRDALWSGAFSLRDYCGMAMWGALGAFLTAKTFKWE